MARRQSRVVNAEDSQTLFRMFKKRQCRSLKSISIVSDKKNQTGMLKSGKWEGRLWERFLIKSSFMVWVMTSCEILNEIKVFSSKKRKTKVAQKNN
jgi:hypothetical protein